MKQMTVRDVIQALESDEGGPISYTYTGDELAAGNLALSRKPFGYDWPDGKWCVYFRTKRERYDVLLFDSESAASGNFLKKVLYNRDLLKKHKNFSLTDLKYELDSAGVSPREYSLHGIDVADQYVLDSSEGRWTVSFSERGSRREVAEFDCETDAAVHLLNRVLVSKERLDRLKPGTQKRQE